MDLLKRIRINFLSLFTAEIAGKLLGAIFYFLIARHLGPEKLGIYSIGISFYIIFGYLVNLGLDPLIIKNVSRNKGLTEEYFNNSIILKIIAGLIAILLIFIVTYFIGYPSQIRLVVLIIASTLIVGPLNVTQNSIYKAHERMGFAALMNFSRPLINLILATALIAAGYGINWVASIHIITSIIIFIIFYMWVTKNKFCILKLSKTYAFIIPFLKEAFPFIFIGFLYILNSKISILILSKFAVPTAVGWYSAAEELVDMFLLVPTMISTVLFPVFSAEYGKSDNRLSEMGYFSVKVLTSLGVPIGVGLIILAPDIIYFLFGTQFENSVIVMRILSVAVCFIFTRSVITWLLTAIEKIKILMWLTLVSLIINVILNLLFIYYFNYIGCAIANLSTMTFFFVSIWIVLIRNFDGFNIFSLFFKPVFSASVMTIILLYFEDFNLFIKIGMGVLTYTLIATVISIFNKEEMILLKKAMGFTTYESFSK